MKLYSYSSKLLALVEARWIKGKFATVGILIGIVIPFGIMKLNQSVGLAPGSRSASTLAAENRYLQQQKNFISYRASKLEMQATQLHERADHLHQLLHSGKIVGDPGSRFTIAAKEVKHHSLILAAKSFHP
jgi:hypothetical protein